MSHRLNPPERILKNIETAPLTLARVAEAIGAEQLILFAEALALLADHVQPDERTLVGSIRDKRLAADIVMHLVSAATEFETAWNTLCLANIPATHRQGRVATECVALAVMLSLPTHDLLKLSGRLVFVRRLKEDPTKPLAELISPTLRRVGKQRQKIEAPIRGPAVMEAFLRAAHDLLEIPPRRVEELRAYRDMIQNPSSHGSVETNSYHFQNYDGGPVGSAFRVDRIDSYRHEAEQLTNLVQLCSDLLDASARYLITVRERSEEGSGG